MSLAGEGWPAADALFRDARWRGSDDAYSLALDGDRTLWLFGDTFVAPAGSAQRAGSAFVRNTVGVQHGRDPLTASVDFAWREGDGAPADFFPGEGPGSAAEWLWPGHGLHRDGRLLLFFMACDLPPGGDPDDPLGLSFRVTGWRAIRVADASGPPSDWALEPVPDRPDTGGSVLGSAVLVEDDVVHLWAYRSGIALLARTELAAVLDGDLSRLEWWSGGSGWTSEVHRAAVAVDPAGTEFTVHRHTDGRYVLVDVAPFNSPDAAVCVRWADRPEGPWSERVAAYPIPEAARDDAFVYAGKAHPELSAPGLAVTYASNGKDLERLFHDETLYYPRFAVLPL